MLVAAAVLLAGCSGSLQDSDPDGYRACQALAEAQKAEGDAAMTMGALLAAGEHASLSETADIRDTAEELVPGTWIVDSEALAAVCAASD